MFTSATKRNTETESIGWFAGATCFLPLLGPVFGFRLIFALSVEGFTCELCSGAAGLGSPSSGGSGDITGTLLSSSMGVGLALMGGGGGAEERA